MKLYGIPQSERTSEWKKSRCKEEYLTAKYAFTVSINALVTSTLSILGAIFVIGILGKMHIHPHVPYLVLVGLAYYSVAGLFYLFASLARETIISRWRLEVASVDDNTLTADCFWYTRDARVLNPFAAPYYGIKFCMVRLAHSFTKKSSQIE